MKLREYIKAESLTLAAFGERLGVAVSTVHGWASGARTPDLVTALRIEAGTGGKVTLYDWVDFPALSIAGAA